MYTRADSESRLVDVPIDIACHVERLRVTRIFFVLELNLKSPGLLDAGKKTCLTCFKNSISLTAICENGGAFGNIICIIIEDITRKIGRLINRVMSSNYCFLWYCL